MALVWVFSGFVLEMVWGFSCLAWPPTLCWKQQQISCFLLLKFVVRLKELKHFLYCTWKVSIFLRILVPTVDRKSKILFAPDKKYEWYYISSDLNLWSCNVLLSHGAGRETSVNTFSQCVIFEGRDRRPILSCRLEDRLT